MAGRPKKPEGQTRERLIPVRLNDEEHDLLDRAAKAKGLQISSWIRSEMLVIAKEVLRDAEVATLRGDDHRRRIQGHFGLRWLRGGLR